MSLPYRRPVMPLVRTVWRGTINGIEYRLTCTAPTQDLANDRIVARVLESLASPYEVEITPSRVDKVAIGIAVGTANFDKAASGERWSDRSTSIAHDDVCRMWGEDDGGGYEP